MRFLSWIGRVRFRHVAGLICLVAAVLFLAIDSNILARGAMRYAVSDWDKVSYAIVAGTVPWIIGIMPFLLAITWVPGKYIGRPSVWTAAILVVWIAFVAYNIFGAGGSISFTRTDVITARKFEASREKDTQKRRANLQARLDELPPSTRAAATVESLLTAERAKLTWARSENCRQPRGRTERTFCTDYARLAAELGAAKMRDRLDAELREIDDARAVAGWAAEVVDPVARFWARITGWSELDVQDWAPLATPIVLQLGSWVFLSFSWLCFGFSGHREALFGRPMGVAWAADMSGGSHSTRHQGGGGVPSRALAATSPRFKVVPLAGVTRQVQLARWFFSECARPAMSGGITEQEWYEHYSKICQQSQDQPLSIESFREVAKEYIADMRSIDGVNYYMKWMPQVPGRVA